MATLKTETAAYHQKLESLPYFSELIAHRLPLECYVNQLRALSVIHSVLEGEIAASANDRITHVWEDGLRKLPLLMDDLHFFEPRVPADNTPSTEAALSMVEKIRLRGIEHPLSLLGYLYVMEGSTLGNHLHQPDIATSYHLDGFVGSRYYSNYKDNVATKWQHFSQRMDQALDDPALHAPIVEAAHEAFAGLEILYNVLFPVKKSENSLHVARINPEAGNHPIPSDKREIQAALKASNQCWNEYPYLEKRYGTRGKRFTDSDSCWLATLAVLDQRNVQKQVDWLCRVLAPRGMPSLMMESILCHLSQELTAAVPENIALYQKLHNCSETLKENRNRLIAEKTFKDLADEFEKKLEPDMRETYKNTGLLLVSAVVDEKNGVTGVLSGIQEWLVDTDRFSNSWIAAVEQTLHEAKRIAAWHQA